VRYCYEQFRSKIGPHEGWKKKSSSGFQKKIFNSSRLKNYGKYSRGILPSRSVYQQNFPSQSGNKPFQTAPIKTDNLKKEPLKCWGCGENNRLSEFTHRQLKNKGVYNIQGSTIINDVVRSMPRIYVALDNNQVNYQASVVELEGMIANHPISILIDPSSNLSYVSPQTISKCKLKPIRHVKPWLVQLSTGTKRKVVEAIPAWQFIKGGLPT
jgi:hypothetical protein